MGLSLSLDEKVDETLAWLAAFNFSREPDVEAKARLLLLDTIACATAGFAEPELLALAADMSTIEAGVVRWPGMRAGLSASAAAYAAARAACWHEACEGLARAHGRPGLHTIPAALSLALALGAPLGGLLHAIIWGYELGGRFGEAMRIRPGMHVDGSWGALAAAAGAARMRGGDATEVRAAMGLAACQIPNSLYLPVRDGSNARNSYCGHAAAMGLFYASTARAGCATPSGVFLEAARFVVGDPQRDTWPWAPVGEMLILQSYLKPFAAVRHVHYPVQCALDWRAHEIDPRSIEAITVEIYPEALTYCGNRAPTTAIQAQFSLSYGVAYALQHGELGPGAYDLASLNNVEQRRLEAAVVLRADEAMTGRGARILVQARGEQIICSVDSVAGDPDLPMQDSDVIAKAMRYMSTTIGESRAAAIVAGILDGEVHENTCTILS